MVALVLCPACQFGKHEDHIGPWQPAPEGMFGGASCPCEGGCVDIRSVNWAFDYAKKNADLNE